MFHYTVETSKSIEESVQSLENTLKEEGFGVLWKFNIQETLQNKGFDFNQAYLVLEVCNAKEANRVLSENHLVGYFLPCKIVLYEDHGKTKIGLPKPTSLIQMVEDDSLKNFAEDIEQRLIGSIDKSLE